MERRGINGLLDYWKERVRQTTLARRISKQRNAILIDGDEIREIFPADFSDEGREAHQRRMAALAKLFESQGFEVIVACVSPRWALRKELQATFKDSLEISLPFGTLWEGTTYEETPTV